MFDETQKNYAENFFQKSDPIKQAIQKRSRSKSSSGEKNYKCGCGKGYLSYPALYTHVKNKHDGIFPEGTIIKSKTRKPTVIYKFILRRKKVLLWQKESRILMR